MNNLPAGDIDFLKYLNEEEMKTIATRIYTEKLTAAADQMFANRSEMGITVLNQLVGAAAEQYVAKLGPKYEDEFFRLSHAILMEPVNTDSREYDDFSSSVRNALGRAAEKHIDANQESYTSEIETQVRALIKTMIGDNIRYKIAQKIDIHGIIKTIIQEELEAAEKKVKEQTAQ